MADQKLTQLTEIQALHGDELLYVVDDPGGTPVSRKILTQLIASGVNERYDPTPTVTQTEDDEFAAGSLDAKWSVITNTVSSVNFGSIWRSHLSAVFTGAQAYVIEQAYAPAGDFSIALCARIGSITNGSSCVIRIFNSSNTDGMALQFVSNSAVMQLRLDSLDTSTPANRQSTSLTAQAFWSGKVYIALQRTTNTWTPAISLDGLTWVEIGTHSKTFTVHHFRIELNGPGTKVRMGFDWVRRDWVTLP